MAFIKVFEEIGKHDAAEAGGKGASLGEMTKAGIPVPPGFVVLAPAFERFLDETDLHTEIDTNLHDVKTEDMRSVEHASEKIQKLILEAKMPEDIAQEVLDNFKTLGTKFVAVRSSATAEDSDSAAWAGQLDTYLNTTKENLLRNVQRCWASLFTARAIFYRFEKELHLQQISVAVVIQKMVQSEVSGIAFSVHPVTEDHNQLIIEAGLGLGEAIVSGSLTPDSYVVEKEPRRILDKSIAEQEKGIFKKGNEGNEWRGIPKEERGTQKLNDKEILELSELVLKIENHYGFPCDIEWAREGGQFYITQSRPITTLSPFSSASLKKKVFSKKVSSDKNSQRGYYRDTMFRIMGRYATYPADTELWHGEHTSRYFEETFGIWKEILGVCVFDKEFYMYICTPYSFQNKLHNRIRELYQSDPKALEKIFLKFYDDKAWATREILKLQSINLASLSNYELAEVYRQSRDVAHRIVIYDQLVWLGEEYWPPLLDAVLVEKLRLVKDSPEYTDALFALIKPREISTTLLEKKAVIKATLAVQKKTQTLEASAGELAREFGWMPVLTYGTPWDADHYLEEIKGEMARDRKTLEKELKELENYSALRDQDFKKMVTQCSLSSQDSQIFIDFGLAVDTRNEAEYMGSFAGFHLLALYAEIGPRLHLSVNEIRTLFEAEIIDSLLGTTDPRRLLAEKRRVVAWGIDANRNRFNYSSEEGEEILAYLESDKKTSGEGSSKSVRGVTASRGKVRGRARLVPTPDHNHKVQEGDILFAFATMTDNLPAMKKAAAIVTEVGGLTCHAAVVSREFDKPCIVGLVNAMRDFKDGDLVEVDADKGIVRKIT